MSCRTSLDEYPEQMTAHDLAEYEGVSVKTISKRHREGAYLFAEIKPRIGKLHWSRERLRQRVNGELLGLTGRKLRAVS